MKLPHGERAVVDIEKLTEYCLNSDHPRGKHKARVFQAACGFSAQDADVMREQLLTAAVEGDATPVGPSAWTAIRARILVDGACRPSSRAHGLDCTAE